MKLWMARHKTLILWLFNILTAFAVYCLVLVVSRWWLLGVFWMYFMSVRFSDFCRGTELNESIRILNELCDPEPFLKTVELQILKTGASSVVYQTLLHVNKACALSNMGKHEENLQLLREINIDAHPGIVPAMKHVYYNNLVGAYMRIGKIEIAGHILEKAEQLLSWLKNRGRAQKHSDKMHQLTSVEYKLQLREFDEATALLESIDEDDICKRDRVEKYWLKAKILIAQGRAQDAIPCLRYVIEHGNKLYVATEAQQELSAIENL